MTCGLLMMKKMLCGMIYIRNINHVGIIIEQNGSFMLGSLTRM